MPLAANLVVGSGLNFTRMTHLRLGSGFDLQYSLVDRTLTAELCVGQEDNRVTITGTMPSTREAAVLNAIDQFGKWGQNIELWMVSRKAGAVVARTQAVNFKTHVKPYYGKLKISEIGADTPAMTYPGNGSGRTLSPLINNRYYFKNGGTLETSDAMRGFDCTTFPLALFTLSLPPPGYGKQVCDAAGAVKCDLEEIKATDLQNRFKENVIPNGLYILFSAGHVLLYNSDINTLYEFNHGGFRKTPAGDRDLTGAPQGLWWMRKLDEKYRPFFG